MNGKQWYQSKTIWIGVLSFLIGLTGLLVPFFKEAVFTAASITALVEGALMIVLRLVTNQPINQ